MFVFLFTNTHRPRPPPMLLRLGISRSELKGFGEDHRARTLSAVEIIVTASLLRTCSCCKTNVTEDGTVQKVADSVTSDRLKG